MTIQHDNIPNVDGTRRKTRQQYHEGILTRVIASTIHGLDLTALRGIYAPQPQEDRLDHMIRISELEDDNFEALSTYTREEA